MIRLTSKAYLKPYKMTIQKNEWRQAQENDENKRKFLP